MQIYEFTEAELEERMIELVIANTRIETFQHDLLGNDKNLTLQEALKIGCQLEAATKGAKQLTTLRTPTRVDAVQKRRAEQRPCKNCGRLHWPRECPAFHSKCYLCKKQGIWKAVCCKAKQAEAYTDRRPTKEWHRKKQGYKEQVHDIQAAADECTCYTDSDSISHGFYV